MWKTEQDLYKTTQDRKWSDRLLFMKGRPRFVSNSCRSMANETEDDALESNYAFYDQKNIFTWNTIILAIFEFSIYHTQQGVQ